MDIFEALREDHEKQRALVDALVKTHGESEERAQLFQELKAELNAHAIAEERNFYTNLLEEDETQEDARHAIAEHHEIDELIEKLEETELSSPAWLATAKDLHHKVHHHLDEEEQEFFKAANKVLASDEKKELGENFEKEKEEYVDQV